MSPGNHEGASEFLCVWEVLSCDIFLRGEMFPCDKNGIFYWWGRPLGVFPCDKEMGCFCLGEL